MEAKKCDRCGELYPRPMCHNRYRIVEDRWMFGDATIDLCDKCYKDLLDFLRVKEDNNDKL